VPGPGHYPNPKSIFKGDKSRRARASSDMSQKKYLGVHSPQQLMLLKESDAAPIAIFGCTESRPCLSPEKVERAAGPHEYDRNASVGQSVSANLREAVRIGQGGAFSSTKKGDRFYGTCLAPTRGLPDPGEYHHLHQAEDHNTSVDSAGGAFRSGVPQLPPDHSVDNKPKPGPGWYEAPSAIRVRRPSGLKQGKTEHLCFGSSRERFGGAEGPEPTWKSNPGPGEYDAKKAGRRVGGATKSTSNRSSFGQGEGPGPGRYEVSKSLYKRTFNSTGETAGLQIRHVAQGGTLDDDIPGVLAPSPGGGAGGGMAGRVHRLSLVTAPPHTAEPEPPEGIQG